MLELKRHIKVTDRDGETHTVSVRLLGLQDYPALLAAMGADEIEQAVVYTGRDREFLERLAPESQEQIILTGEEMNADFFERWLERQKRRQQLLLQGDAVQDALSRALESVLREQTSSASSPTSAPKPASPSES